MWVNDGIVHYYRAQVANRGRQRATDCHVSLNGLCYVDLGVWRTRTSPQSCDARIVVWGLTCVYVAEHRESAKTLLLSPAWLPMENNTTAAPPDALRRGAGGGTQTREQCSPLHRAGGTDAPALPANGSRGGLAWTQSSSKLSAAFVD